MVNSMAFTLQMDAVEDLDVHEYFFSPKTASTELSFCIANQFVLIIKHDVSIKTLLLKKLMMKILVKFKCH